MDGSKVLNTIKHNIVAQSFVCRSKWRPVLKHVNKLSAIDWNHPVVREMLVTNFAHLGILSFQNERTERKQGEHDLRLVRQSNAAMLGLISIYSYHIVNVVVLHYVDQGFNKLLINFEPGKVLLGVLVWNWLSPSGFVVWVPSILAKFGNRRGQHWGTGARVPDVAGDKAFSCNARDESVKQQEHNPVVIYGLNN